MSQFIYGLHAIKALLNAQAESIERLLFINTGLNPAIQALQELAKQNRVATESLSKAQFDDLLGKEAVHQGVVAQCKNVTGFNEEVLEDLLDDLKKPPFLLLLDGVQDPHNLGAILRSANAFGVHAVIAPKDRAVGLTPVVHKVACGAASLTPFIQVTNLSRTMDMLKKRGIWLTGMDEHTDFALHKIDLSGAVGLVLGNEGQGLRELTKKNCDHIAKIALPGAIKSLNVSVAAGCALFEVNRQRAKI